MTETRETKLRERFEKWAKKWYVIIRPQEFSKGQSVDGLWTYDSERLQHAWAGWQAAEAIYRAEGREDGLEEVALAMCEFCRGEVPDYNAQRIPGQWRGKDSNGWWHTNKQIGYASEPCKGTFVRSLSSKKDSNENT